MHLLKVQPEIGGCAECPPDAQRRIGSDCATAMNDFIAVANCRLARHNRQDDEPGILLTQFREAHSPVGVLPIRIHPISKAHKRYRWKPKIIMINRTTKYQNLIDSLFGNIPNFGVFQEASDHNYNCRCDKCLEWWAQMGPDGGDPGDYGPFTKDEVNGKQKELNFAITP